MIRMIALAALLFAFPAQAVVNIAWVTVGDPGNLADTTTHGAVSNEYRIGKYEVSNTEYAEFLNAVADTDTNGLYSTGMGSGDGGITRSGSSGSYSYSTIAGRENMPVNYVSFYDALRFANWLHNAQPSGAQDSTTTEDGAYDMSLGSSVVRKAGAEVFLASSDEWYKAAFYKGGSTSAGYWGYPAGSDAIISCTSPGATANTANCGFFEGGLTDRGSYTGAASPSGTFDQGGNVREWSEWLSGGGNRGLRGGSFTNSPGKLSASEALVDDPANEGNRRGFRVASLVPTSPPVPSLTLFGTTILLSLLGLAGVGKLRG